MDSLAELIPLLLVAAYYLLQGRRRAAQKRDAQRQTAPQQTLVSDDTRAPTPFQQFMEQLEEAMAEASGEPASAPRAEPTVETAPAPPIIPTRLPPSPPQRNSEFHAVEGSFDSATPSDHIAHGFGAENPLSEERFERESGTAVRSTGSRATYDPHGLKQRPAPRRDDAQLGALRARLKNAQAARDAFVLQTIFGPRGGRRADSR